MERIEMNSKSLQKNFVQIYKNFFINNDIVTSGCYTIPWGYEGGFHRSDSVNFRSKIPLKCYVGAKKTKKPGISFKEIVFFDVTKNAFETVPYKDTVKEEEKIINFLEEFIRGTSQDFGLELTVLSETTRGHGFGFSGTHLVLVATIVLLYAKGVASIQDISQDEIFRLAWKLDIISRYGNSIGEASAHALSKHAGPSYLFSEKFSPKIDPNEVDVLYSEYVIMAEKFHDSIVTEELLVDTFIIFSGIPTDTKLIEQSKLAEKNENSRYEKFIKNLILDKNSKNISFAKFGEPDSIHPHLLETLGILNLKSIFHIQKILASGNDEHEVENLIENINDLRNLIGAIEKQSPFAEDFIYFFRKNIKNFREKMGIMPVYSGKNGGGYMIVTKAGFSRDTVEKAFEELKQFYPQVAIEYSSHVDGSSKDGVLVEQYISQGKYSSYVDKNKIVYRNNKGEQYVDDYNTILEREKDGLLFDTIHNKIYLQGGKLTSKEIPSQNTTIEIISKLLEHVGEEISNKSLSNSSYANNKNEMVGKIIIPLLRLIEEKTQEQLPLICKGSVNDFYLKMGDIQLKIGIIQRM